MSEFYIYAHAIDHFFQNTFVGTLAAGLVLAWVGFKFYKRQKQIDSNFDDLKKKKEAANALFAAINSATSKFGGLLNMYDEKNAMLVHIRTKLGPAVESGVFDKTTKELEAQSSQIQGLTDSLTSMLAIKNEAGASIEAIGKNILILNIYMQGSTITVKKLGQTEIEEWRAGWETARKNVVDELNKIFSA